MVLYPNKLPESERVCSGICIIQLNWQSILSKGHFLRSKDGKRFISASSLSSALSAAKNNMTSAAYNIRETIERLRK